MFAEIPRSPEKLGAISCRQVIEHIVRFHPEIAKVSFAKFLYVPQIIGREKGDICLELTREEIFNGKLDELIAGLEAGWDMGIRSLVTLKDGSFAHIPMMDFSLPKSPENIAIIKKRMRRIAGEERGLILESGKSYHYYGVNLRTEESWREFMAKCLLTSVFLGKDQPFLEIADHRYIGHSLIGGGCVLRITTNAERKFMPVVVDILE